MWIMQHKKKPDYYEYYRRDEFDTLLELSKEKPYVINMSQRISKDEFYPFKVINPDTGLVEQVIVADDTKVENPELIEEKSH